MTTLTAGKVSGAKRWAVKSAFQNWRDRVRARREQRQAIYALKSVNAAILRDIGIDRSEITSLVHSQPEGRRKTYDRR